MLTCRHSAVARGCTRGHGAGVYEVRVTGPRRRQRCTEGMTLDLSSARLRRAGLDRRGSVYRSRVCMFRETSQTDERAESAGEQIFCNNKSMQTCGIAIVAPLNARRRDALQQAVTNTLRAQLRC